MPTPTSAVKVNPLTGALIDPIAATFASANGFLTGGTSDAKESVVCATTANGTLATAFENGDTVDGIALATGNRILLKNQSAQAENGIYTVNASGAPTRATDFDAWTEIVGAFVSVESGTVNAGTQWLCNVVSGGTLNTTAITFVVPKNFVDLTTNQTVGGNKYFSASSTMGGVTFSKDGVLTAVNAQLVFPEDDSVLAVFAAAGELSLRTTGVTDVTFPLSGTLATTTGNVATATALATARNIFNISFNGTANVAGDATNTGHFASIPGTGAAGHFITENGTAPTLIAGRSAWYSDGSGVPSFKNGTGTAVTLVRSSDIGVSVQAYDADLTTWAGITPGANVGTALAIAVGSAGSFVVNGGAGGTPSSMTGTNISGTAASLTAGLVTSIGSLTGDVTSSNRATTLATVNANVGSFGSATQAGTFTVNAKGLVTAASNTTVTPAVGSITGLGAGVGTFLATPSGANLASALTSELPVSKGGTGLTSGTSGGIPAFTATGTIASSTLLAANAIVIGGGAGVAPSTTTTGAGVLTALGIAPNAAGGFSTLRKYTGSTSLNGYSLTAAGGVGTIAITVTGAVAGDKVLINYPPALAGLVTKCGEDVTTDTVAVSWYNADLLDDADWAAGKFITAEIIK